MSVLIIVPAAAQEEHLPHKCTVMNDQGELPTCTQTADGKWIATYPDDGLGGGGDGGVPGAFVALFVLSLLAGVAFTIWKVSAARDMARRSGMNEGDATVMTLLTDDGFEATYLAANLRPQPGQAPPGTPATPTASAADRLRELDDLRSQGLITDEEHAARRQAIIETI